MTLTFLPKDRIDPLDLVYIGMPQSRAHHTLSFEDGVQSLLYTGDEFKAFIFGAIIDLHGPTGFMPCPLFSIGEVKGQPIPDLQINRYKGFIPHSLENGILRVRNNQLESEIDQPFDGSQPSVYCGAGVHAPASLFDPQIPVELGKELFFARSPNRSISLDELAVQPIITLDHTEEMDGPQHTYRLVYANLTSLKKEKQWAISGREGFLASYNPHLVYS